MVCLSSVVVYVAFRHALSAICSPVCEHAMLLHVIFYLSFFTCIVSTLHTLSPGRKEGRKDRTGTEHFTIV